MKAKVFISRSNEGWREISIPKEFQHYNYDKLVNKVYKLLKPHSFKGILITENPLPFSSNR
jgi:hypothetical protein